MPEFITYIERIGMGVQDVILVLFLSKLVKRALPIKLSAVVGIMKDLIASI